MKNLKLSKELLTRIVIYTLIVVLGFTLDRLTKSIVVNNLSLNVFRQVEIIPNFLYFAYVRNTGGAWSILSNATWLLAIISVAAVVGITYYLFTKKQQRRKANAYISSAFYYIVFDGGVPNFFK